MAGFGECDFLHLDENAKMLIPFPISTEFIPTITPSGIKCSK